MEVAGLALGAVALIVPACRGYQQCSTLFKDIRHHSKAFVPCLREFRTQRDIFQNECKILLATVVGTDAAADMLRDMAHKNWMNADVVDWCSHALSDGLKDAFTTSKETLDELDAILRGLGANRSFPDGEVHSGLFSKGVRRIEWAANGKARVKELLEVLRRQNRTFLDLRTQQLELQKLDQLHKARSKIVSGNDPEVPKNEFKIIRKVARRLYEELSRTARCQCHKVNLRLDFQVPKQNIRVDNRYIVNFRLVITPDQDGSDQCNSPECTCLLVESWVDETPRPLDCISPNISNSFKHAAAPRKPTSCLKRKLSMPSTNEKSTGKRPKDAKLRWAVEQDKTTGALSGSLETSFPGLKAIDNLCNLLTSPQPSLSEGGSSLLGRLKLFSTDPTNYADGEHLVYRESLSYNPSSRTSLGEILSQNHQLQILERQERIRLAVVLATAVLQYGSFSASWFQEHWRTNDVFFFLESPKKWLASMDPYIAAPFEDPMQPKASRPLQRSLARNKQLFSLAVVLTEIAFGDRLDNISLPQDIKGQLDDPIWEYTKVQSIIDSSRLRKEVGRKYADAVERCLYGDFGQGSADLKVPCVQEAFYEGVVKQLECCLKIFD